MGSDIVFYWEWWNGTVVYTVGLGRGQEVPIRTGVFDIYVTVVWETGVTDEGATVVFRLVVIYGGGETPREKNEVVDGTS